MKETDNVFNQEPFECKLDWGLNGIKEAVKRKDIIIIVDILSFSTTVTTAIHYGSEIFPFSKTEIEDIDSYAKEINAEVVLGRSEAKLYNKQSLSSLSFNKSCNGKKFLLPSRNGSTYSKIAENNDFVFIGSIINARPVAQIVNRIRKFNKIPVTIISCGERWRGIRNYVPILKII
ncbi:MAG TPA: 2-phosphosulfolactate phosphatase [Candidatus Paceibacterota bacterium]|jgi:2-phosphosulfolactate phosphatase|nr:2-phosphosulfolactate phosphatase [Candidatus Paceibacterota bacterium]